jgi:hypothetical protein
VSGNGLTNNSKDPKLSITQTCGKILTSLKIVSALSNLITFEIPPNPSNLGCTINVTQSLTYMLYWYQPATSRTPSLKIIQINNTNYYINQTTNTKYNISFINAYYLDALGNPTTSIYPFTLNQINASLLYFNASYLPVGTFKFYVHVLFIGYATITPANFTINFTNNPTATAASVSYGGGYDLILTGAGFQTVGINNNYVTVCGLKAKVNSASQTSLTIDIPALITPSSQSAYQIGTNGPITGLSISDTALLSSNPAFDNNTNSYYSSNNDDCYIGYDFGGLAVAALSSIRYMPNPNWAKVGPYLLDAFFEGSNDSSTWTNIFTIDSDAVNFVRTGWNYWQPDISTTNQSFRYIRFRQISGSSQCQLA